MLSHKLRFYGASPHATATVIYTKPFCSFYYRALFLIIFKGKLKSVTIIARQEIIRIADMTIIHFARETLFYDIKHSILSTIHSSFITLPFGVCFCFFRSAIIFLCRAEINCTLFSLAFIVLEHMVIALIIRRTCSQENYTSGMTIENQLSLVP